MMFLIEMDLKICLITIVCLAQLTKEMIASDIFLHST